MSNLMSKLHETIESSERNTAEFERLRSDIHRIQAEEDAKMADFQRKMAALRAQLDRLNK